MPEPNTGCWLWFGNMALQTGYGLFRVGTTRSDPIAGAHRVNWERHRGPIPAGLWVLHRCDTPACVNPDHLFLGTHDDNQQDKFAKHRQARGSAVNTAKLTPEQVREILVSSEGLTALANRYGVRKQAIWCIRKRLTWTSITRETA